MGKKRSDFNCHKLPSGNWRCIADLGTDQTGKRIRKSFTAKTKQDAIDLAKRCEVLEKDSMRSVSDKDITVRLALERYINKRKDGITTKDGVPLKKVSPSTIRGYEAILNNNINMIADIPCLKLDDAILQKWIGALCSELSAKSVRNAWFLVTAALKDVIPVSRVIDFHVDLPAISKKDVFVPHEADIEKLIDYLRENEPQLYRAVILAAFGTLRRSEICALTSEDIDRENNVVSVNKALVESYSGSYVLKDTKTELSERDVVLPSFVIDALPSSGKIIDHYPAWVSKRFNHVLSDLDIPHFRFHDLRHYSASIMHFLGAPNETIMHRGGWASDVCLNQHYRGNMSEYDKAFTEKLNEHFENKFAE